MAYEPQFSDKARPCVDQLFQGDGGLMASDPELVERLVNFMQGEVVDEIELDVRSRYLCWLSSLLGCQGLEAFREIVCGAIASGVDPVAIQECVYQACAYLGVGRVLPFVRAKNEAFEACGISLPLEPQAQTTPDKASRYEGGERAQVACFGEQMVGYKDRGNPDYPHIAEWLVRNCFGDYYARGGLSIAEREMCTFCYIAAQGGCEPQLKAHAQANVQCGNDRAFLIRVVSNNVPILGYPRSLNALAAVDAVTLS